MRENAELQWNLRTRLTGWHMLLGTLAYVAVLTTGFVSMAIEIQAGGFSPKIPSAFLAVLLAGHFIVAAGVAVSQCGGAIARERELDTLDAKRLTAMTPADLVLGKLLGITAPLHLLNACGLVAALPLASMAGYSLGGVLVVFAILTAATLFYGAFGLALSATSNKGDEGMGKALGIGCPATGFLMASELPLLECATPMPALMHLFAARSEASFAVPMLGVLVPVEALTLGFYAFGTVACLVAAVRLLDDPSRLPWDRRQMLAGFLAMAAALVASLAGAPFSGGSAPGIGAADLALYYVIVMIVLTALVIAMTPSARRIEEHLWRGPDSWRELFLGERGSPLPFVLLLGTIASFLPCLLCLPMFTSSGVSVESIAPLLVAGSLLTLLVIKLGGNVAEWSALALPGYTGSATALFLLSVAFGPVTAAMLLLDKWEGYAPWLLLGNPAYVLSRLVEVPGRANSEVMASVSLLLFVVAATASCAIASRRMTRLAADIEAKRRSLYAGS